MMPDEYAEWQAQNSGTAPTVDEARQAAASALVRAVQVLSLIVEERSDRSIEAAYALERIARGI